MKNIIKIYLILLCTLLTFKTNAQDPHFSQFYANPMYLNPAITGTNFCPRWIMNYRNQWPAIPGDYVTYSSSFDFGLNELHGGVGLIALHDNAGSGVMTTNNISLLYSYHTRISSTTTLLAGFQISHIQRQLDTRQYFGDQIDQLYGFIYPTFDPFSNQEYHKTSYSDISAGILISNDRYFVGFAGHHLTEPNYSFLDSFNEGKLPRKLTIHGGTKIILYDLGLALFNNTFLSKFSTITPHFIFQKQSESEQVILGAHVASDNFMIGSSFRRGFNNSDAIIFLLGYELEKYKIGYSYDLTVSKLGMNSGGAHEISLQIQLGCFYKNPSKNNIPCPNF